MKITPQWISRHFDKKKELEKYRYKTKYRREEQYGEIDYQSYVQKLNHNGELPAPLPNRE